MTKQKTSPEEMRQLIQDMVPLWMKTILGSAFLLIAGVAGVSIFKQGSRQVGLLLMALSMAGIWFFMGKPTEPAKTYLKRPQGILDVLWILVFSAWFIYEKNWVPAICFGGASFLALIEEPRKQEGELWWRYYLRSPLAIITALLFLGYVVWFAWSTGGWVPIGCVLATLPSLRRDLKVRCSLGENLTRGPFLGSLAVLLVAGIWMLTHLSFGNVMGFVSVLCLIISDVYLHTSTEDASFALPHPQS